MKRLDDGSYGYSYEDLRPIHPLWHVTLATQALGALVGLLARGDVEWARALWRGGVLATFPGFVLGFCYQMATEPDGIRENKGMVAFTGVFALVFSLFGVYFPQR